MRLLHSIKIVIFKNNLLACTLRKDHLKLLNKFVIFFVFCYIPWWFTCPIGTAAAQNDIAFYNIVCKYEKIYEDISKAVKESFKFHQWYIISETIPLKLFDEGLDRCDKDNLAKTILSYPQEESNTRTDIGYGKSRFRRKIPEYVADAA